MGQLFSSPKYPASSPQLTEPVRRSARPPVTQPAIQPARQPVRQRNAHVAGLTICTPEFQYDVLVEKIDTQTLTQCIYENFGTANEYMVDTDDTARVHARKLIQEAGKQLGDEIPYNEEHCQINICVAGYQMRITTRNAPKYVFDLTMEWDPENKKYVPQITCRQRPLTSYIWNGLRWMARKVWGVFSSKPALNTAAKIALGYYTSK